MIVLDGDSAAFLWEAGPFGFGGHPYGLEPLTLPSAPRHRSGGSAQGTRVDRDDLERLLEPLAEPPLRLPLPDTADRLFWFRWITGHQIAFIVWRELGGLTARGTVVPAPRAEDQGRIARLIRAYSATLLYTSSCTREVYHRLVRPSMVLQHPRFSGAWAPDYGPVRPLLRGRLSDVRDTVSDSVRRECELNATVHEGIADKLVPDDPSLFQSFAGHGAAQNRHLLGVLFDTYFLTLRTPLPHSAVLAQLARRVRAVRDDLESNGLYPESASSRHEKPPSLVAAEISEIEETMAPLLVGVTREAVETAYP